MQSKKYETGPSVSISHAAKEPLSDLVGNIGVPSIGQQQLDVLVTPPQRSHMEGCKTLGRPGATTQHNTNHRRHHPHHTKCPSNRRQQHCEWTTKPNETPSCLPGVGVHSVLEQQLQATDALLRLLPHGQVHRRHAPGAHHVGPGAPREQHLHRPAGPTEGTERGVLTRLVGSATVSVVSGLSHFKLVLLSEICARFD